MSDLIDRQEALDALCETCASGREDCALYPYCAEIDAINCLPTAEPEPKTGKWNKYYRMHSGDTFVCNRCGSCFVVLQGADKMNFCPNCEADMRGEENE